MVQIKRIQETGASDPILTRISEEDKVPWYQKPNLRYLYFMLFPTCMGIELTSGFDSQMINALQIVPFWKDYFGDPQGSLKGIIAAAYSLGAILSLPFIPIVNDKFGRRWSIFGGSVIMVIGALVQGFSQHVGMYIVARMILGFGIPTCIVSGSSLIGELGYPKERPILTSLFNVAYFVGQITAAGICFGTNNIESDWAWRIPSLLQICPSLLQIIFVFFLPESPRWLITQDRAEDANEILIKYHAEGDRDSEYYLGDLLEMIGLTDSTVKQKINLGIAGWSLICGFTVAMLVRTFRRRVMYLACTISLLLCYIAWTISMERAVHALDNEYKNEGASVATIFFIFMYSPCYNIGYNALTYTYLVELWPYALRSRGISLFQLFGRLAGFFTTFVNPIGIGNASWRYLISYCCWLAFEVVFVYFMFPETAGRTLEELAFLFEDKALADQAVGAVEKAIHHEDMDPVGEVKSGGGRAEVVENVGARSKV
ncbi:High-affinity glucose transporter [Colletotrichum tanaceti]|uniref:High-affinity glucose transporter n=1 Tax=Colletotrichum tanaceti TaxID=1306861 RepID=A0A4U6XNE0_9PEZI|nr:High-affinity glucose transporter [Colletotrichum tanaceti]